MVWILLQLTGLLILQFDNAFGHVSSQHLVCSQIQVSPVWTLPSVPFTGLHWLHQAVNSLELWKLKGQRTGAGWSLNRCCPVMDIIQWQVILAQMCAVSRLLIYFFTTSSLLKSNGSCSLRQLNHSRAPREACWIHAMLLHKCIFSS